MEPGIAKRVAEIYDMDLCEFLSKGKQPLKVRARSLFRQPPKQVELRAPAVGYSVERGEVIARENGYGLIE